MPLMNGDFNHDYRAADWASIAAGDNMYQITIRATETSGTTNRALSTTQDFTVEVTELRG